MEEDSELEHENFGDSDTRPSLRSFVLTLALLLTVCATTALSLLQGMGFFQ